MILNGPLIENCSVSECRIYSIGRVRSVHVTLDGEVVRQHYLNNEKGSSVDLCSDLFCPVLQKIFFPRYDPSPTYSLQTNKKVFF